MFSTSGMSAGTRCKIKAVLFIAVLAVAEARNVQLGVRTNAAPSSQSGDRRDQAARDSEQIGTLLANFESRATGSPLLDRGQTLPNLATRERKAEDSMESLADRLVDSVSGRAFRSSSRQPAGLDRTTLGKHSHLAASSRAAKPLLVRSSRSVLSAGSLSIASAGHRDAASALDLRLPCAFPGLATCQGGLRRGLWISRSASDEGRGTAVKKDVGKDFTGLIASLALAAAVCIGVFFVRGGTSGQEWLAAYLTEMSLSIDNLLVFVLVFKYFKVEEGEPQNRILSYGILGAAVMRAICVLLGVEVIEKFEPVLILFAAILVFSSYKILVPSGKDDDEEDLNENLIVKGARRVIKVSDTYDGSNFFTVAADGARVATPLLLALVVIEISDIVFAVDSIPAVFGVSRDSGIVYSSNLLAILSLRSLYSFIASAIPELRFLEQAVGIILGFIGLKIVAEFAGYEISTAASLGIVGSLLSGGVGLSLAFPEGSEGKAESSDD